MCAFLMCFFFQAEDGIRDYKVTGVQTCALPILTLSHSPSAADDYTAIEEQLTQACLAEEIGFDSVWLTEHNFTGEAVYCDPIPFASALAARTTRVRIGFAVIQ